GTGGIERRHVSEHGDGEHERDARGFLKRADRRRKWRERRRRERLWDSAGRLSVVLAETQTLAAGYGRVPAVENVSFEVDSGQRVALLGPNGGGKTTLLRALLGELRPMRGTVVVRGRCGSVPQTERSRLDYPVSALDVVLMGALSRLPWWRRPGRKERQAALAALEHVGM